jgi:lipopolysaccharide transport system permease protein
MSITTSDRAVHIYGQGVRPRGAVARLREMASDLASSRELAWQLFLRDTRARYRQSFLGLVWLFLPPLFTGLVFVVLQRASVLSLPPTDVPYPVFALVGTILWQLFSESLGAPLRAVQAAKPLLARISFPREALVLAALYDLLLGLGVKMLLLVGVLLMLGHPVLHGVFLALPLMLLMILMGLVIGMLITPIGMLYNDVGSALPMVIQVWFFLTPVVYPTPKSYPFNLIAQFNPMAPVLTTARDLVTKGALVAPPMSVFVILAATVVIGMVAWMFYRSSMPIVIERMSA